MTDGPRCRGCNHRMKQPTPSGYGPVCERRLTGPPPARTGRVTTRAAQPMDGQAELPLEPLQATLWPM